MYTWTSFDSFGIFDGITKEIVPIPRRLDPPILCIGMDVHFGSYWQEQLPPGPLVGRPQSERTPSNTSFSFSSRAVHSVSNKIDNIIIHTLL